MRDEHRKSIHICRLEPFPEDAPRPLQEKALQTYAVANINERTRKQEK